jgi:hypothetical protein
MLLLLLLLLLNWFKNVFKMESWIGFKCLLEVPRKKEKAYFHGKEFDAC